MSDAETVKELMADDTDAYTEEKNMQVLDDYARRKLIALVEKTIVDYPIGCHDIYKLIKIAGPLSALGITATHLRDRFL